MQIVGFDPGVDGPATLRIADDGTVTERPLPAGETLSLALGERRCAGVETVDGHDACQTLSPPRCSVHTDDWPCARCTGTCDRPIEACRERHAVYLAAFAPDTFKVGVTREWRIERRMREQGADRAAHLRTVADGRIARQVEADLAATVDGLSDRVRVAQKVAGLHRDVDRDAWRSLLGEFAVEAQFAFDYGHDLSSPAVPATLAAGTVRGSQGRLLLLERAGTTYAVDGRDLVGYVLRDGEPAPEVQAGLGAFE